MYRQANVENIIALTQMYTIHSRRVCWIAVGRDSCYSNRYLLCIKKIRMHLRCTFYV